MAKGNVIAFANQKGGVGKSTLCLAYAHFLARQYGNLDEISQIRIIDCDPQSTIAKQRQADLLKLENDNRKPTPPFDVFSFALKETDKLVALINKCREVAGTNTLLDLPSYTKDGSMIPALSTSDFIVCPIGWGQADIDSTRDFIQLLFDIERSLNRDPALLSGKLFFIPNKIRNIGKPNERKRWETFKEKLSHIGIVTPDLGEWVDVTRINTFDVLSENHIPLVDSVFYFIKNKINQINTPKQ